MGGGDPARRAQLIEKLREIIAELRYLNVSDQEILALVQEGGKTMIEVQDLVKRFGGFTAWTAPVLPYPTGRSTAW